MTLPKDRKLKAKIWSQFAAVDEADIRWIHPDKMEEWAEHLVRKLKK